ncbi:hypothetical protein CBM2625_U10005 [Cupriavidus taiwanensis]|nr:hypothetical protein CBM2625_U10005 [Cupriavidus taiwanensis]
MRTRSRSRPLAFSQGRVAGIVLELGHGAGRQQQLDFVFPDAVVPIELHIDHIAAVLARDRIKDARERQDLAGAQRGAGAGAIGGVGIGVAQARHAQHGRNQADSNETAHAAGKRGKVQRRQGAHCQGSNLNIT